MTTDGDQVTGECTAWGVPFHFRACPGYADWITIELIEVEEPYRRQGLGRFLMEEQIRYHTARKIKHLLLWTESDNTETHRFYENLHFTYGPQTWRFTKNI